MLREMAIDIACSLNFCLDNSPCYQYNAFMGLKDGKLLRASMQFSIQILHLHDKIDRLSFMKNQMARAATAIGANIHEAEYAESAHDFVHKLKIALKECHETEYWLKILGSAFPNLFNEAELLRGAAGRIRCMLIASIQKMNIRLNPSNGEFFTNGASH